MHYVKSQRLAYSFLEERFNDYTIKETGARYRRGRKAALREYEDSINRINKALFEKLKENGFFVLCCQIIMLMMIAKNHG